MRNLSFDGGSESLSKLCVGANVGRQENITCLQGPSAATELQERVEKKGKEHAPSSPEDILLIPAQLILHWYEPDK